MICVMRNAKDLAVSYFHFNRMNHVQPEAGDWSTFLNNYMEGKSELKQSSFTGCHMVQVCHMVHLVPLCPQWCSARGTTTWTAGGRRNPPTPISSYSFTKIWLRWVDRCQSNWQTEEKKSVGDTDLRPCVQDPGRELDKLCHFLGLSPSSEKKERILSSAHFDNMKQNKMANYSTLPVMDQKVSPFMRKGTVNRLYLEKKTVQSSTTRCPVTGTHRQVCTRQYWVPRRYFFWNFLWDSIKLRLK